MSCALGSVEMAEEEEEEEEEELRQEMMREAAVGVCNFLILGLQR